MMPTQIPNRFTSWKLSETERQLGFLYSDLQLCNIQNLILEAAEAKISLTLDPLNPFEFVQREAELQGQIGILEYLLEQHRLAVETPTQ